MSDRFKGLIVTFKEDLREDYSDRLVEAISLLDGIASVQKSSPVGLDDYLARQRVNYEWRMKILGMLEEP